MLTNYIVISHVAEISQVAYIYNDCNSTICFNAKVGKWSPSQGVVMFPEKPVLWLSQSLQTPRDRAGSVENISVRVITAMVC